MADAADILVPPIKGRARRSFHAPSWTSIIFFGLGVAALSVVQGVNAHSTAEIQKSRHENCASQQLMDALLITTFHRLQEAESSHIPRASDPGITMLRISILHDFALRYRTFPIVKCPP